jgi:hypothetical protein
MMNFAQIESLVRERSSAVHAACAAALDEGSVGRVGERPGHLAAREALATFSARKRTAAKAGIVIDGIDELLGALGTLDPADQVLVFHFSGNELVFSVFVHAQRESIVGGIQVHERKGMPPSLGDRGLTRGR